MSIAAELERLHHMRVQGVISDQEFQQAKAQLLSPHDHGHRLDEYKTATEIEKENQMWILAIHLSQYGEFFLPMAGLIAPIVIWQIKRKDSELIDLHGRAVANWAITSHLFAILFIILCFILIGIPLLILLIVISLIYPLVGAIQANHGKVWRYPGAITFFEVD